MNDHAFLPMRLHPVVWFLACWMPHAVGQSGVGQVVPLRLVEGQTDCGGYGRRVEILADVTGFTGAGGEPVGLNGFLAIVNMQDPQTLAFIEPGSAPVAWSIRVTQPAWVSSSVSVAGWSTDTDAANGEYLLATLVLTGNQGWAQQDLAVGCQVASRMVSPGNGPELLATDPGPSLATWIPLTFDIAILDAVAEWLRDSIRFDFSAPSGPIDIRDLVRLLNCTP
ncbi:MAG: hypothetical protein KDC35_07315 [Acidobacteria bacterium]|nr:hypothetical protein [Acidobacteriota bacterium]